MPLVATVTLPAVSAPLTDLPVLLSPDSASGWDSFWATVSGAGGDIRIKAPGGGADYPREVVSLDTGGKTGEIWTKVPVVSDAGTTDVEVWTEEGTEPAFDDPIGRNEVWADYYAVYHMEQTPPAVMVDSTGKGRDMAIAGIGSVSNAPGRFGSPTGALRFDGSESWYEYVAGPPVIPELDWPWSMSCWVSPSSYAAATVLKQISDGTASAVYTMTGFNDATDFYLWDRSGSGINSSNVAGAFQTGQWYVSGGFMRSRTFRYPRLDGVEGSPNTSTVTDRRATYTHLAVGALVRTTGGDPVRFYPGDMDEVRFYAGEISFERWEADRANQSDPASWYTVTDEGGGSPPEPTEGNPIVMLV